MIELKCYHGILTRRREEEKDAPRGGARRRKVRRYPFEVKLKAVKLYQEHDYSVASICQKLGVSISNLRKWIDHYRKSGEDGLKPKTRAPGANHKLPTAIAETIVDLKTAHPNHVHLIAFSDYVEQIAAVMQAAAGEFARDYNRRKRRRGGFWEGRYHATIVDSGDREPGRWGRMGAQGNL